MTKKPCGVIAAGHPKTAEAGQEILKQGGNAFDAAIAAILASFVAEPMLTSVAGGGFLLAHTHHNKNILFDFFTQTPRHKKPISELNFYPIYANFGTTLQEFHIGLGSMAVPGNLAGLFHIHKKLATLPFKTLAEPAIDYAQNGIEIEPLQAYCLNTLLKPIMIATAEAAKVFAPNGSLLQNGDKLIMKDLAATLTYLAEKGDREFYEGDIAHQLIKDCQEQGGHLTLEDLKNYQVIERNPLLINYRGNSFLTNPPPSSGGTLIAFALELLAQLDLTTVEFGSSRHLQILAEVMRLTNQARKASLDGNLYQENIAQKFIAPANLTPYEQALKQIVNKWGSTTHISIVDKFGNAASVTTSNGEGSGYMIPGTGIMVNNMLGEEDLNPQGFHQWPENVRISSMMAPTLVLKDNLPEIVLGSGGSNRIRTAIFQVISNIIDFQMSVTEAVNSPRTHWENNTFHLEAGFEQQSIKNSDFGDKTNVVIWEEKNMFFGGVHTVLSTPELISGAGDPRRAGVVRKVHE